MDSELTKFVKILVPFEEYFFNLPEWEDHTVRITLNTADADAFPLDYEDGIDKIFELCARKVKDVGVHDLWELYDTHKVPYMLVDLTLIDGIHDPRVHLGIEKSSLYVVVTSMGKIVEEREENSYFEICEKDLEGNLIKRFAGDDAHGVSHSYTAKKPKKMGIHTLKDTLMKIMNDTMGLKDEANKIIDTTEHPVIENLYYGVSEAVRFGYIKDSIVRSMKNYVDGITYFELALNWNIHSREVRKLCNKHPLEKDGSNISVTVPAKWVTNMKILKENVKVLNMVNKKGPLASKKASKGQYSTTEGGESSGGPRKTRKG